MRALRSDERALWRETMRGVKLMRALEREAAPPVVPKPPTETKTRRVPSSPAVPAPAKPMAKSISALDRRSAQRLKRGTIPIEARLDLHGMTQIEAHDALSRFLVRAQKHGVRAALVITGKSGVLHGLVPRWLDDETHRGRIIAASRAHAQHGGAGALYLILRRVK
jgi:DNA-nicking Smr family endonuclease